VTEPLFTFAVFTDTHIRAPEGDLSSPYAVNTKANARAEVAAALVAAQNPALTIHLGDMVHPLPHMAAYEPACQEARRVFACLEPNLHFVPGNHDIGDKPHDASPAGAVTSDAVAAYSGQFGDQWSHVDHGDCRFVLINSSIVGSGLDVEQEQFDWLEQVLATDKRTFLFSHYPLFIDSVDEDEHYDNYGLQGRTRLLEVIERHGVEAVLSGHVHQFFYNRAGETKFYCLPATSFTRQDFAELYNAGPEAEFGRNDRGKFGIMLVDVFTDGHRLRFVPTGGAESDAVVDMSQRKPPANSGLVPFMRHAWYQSRDLPYTGAMEEFSRKRARNDYPLLRLWQMGIETVRTPLADLARPESLRRVQDFAATGIRFHMFTTSMPDERMLELIAANRDALAGLEIAQVEPDLARVKEIAKALMKTVDVPLYVSRAATSADNAVEGQIYAHNVWTGYRYARRAEILDGLADTGLPLRPIFAVGWRADWLGKIGGLQDAFEHRGIEGAVAVQLMTGSPATANFDDDYIVESVAELVRGRARHPRVTVMLDTFETIDRGYNPRHGLIDRLGNLTPAGRSLTLSRD
jgi:predicted phosphodiesterase